MPAQSVDPGIDEEREHEAVEADAHRDAGGEGEGEFESVHRAGGRECGPRIELDVSGGGTIVILVSNEFIVHARLDVRRVGAILGGAFGLIVSGVGLAFADGAARATTLMLGGMVLVLGALLGWVFSRGALRPGFRSAISAAAGITVLAVPLGALALGLLMSVGSDSLTPAEVVAASFGLAFVGLLFFGLPLAGLTFIVANVWVGALRLVVRMSNPDITPLIGPTRDR